MRYFSAIVLCTLCIFGCRKADRNKDTDLTLTEDAANAQVALYEVFLPVHEACLSTPGFKSFISCATITSDTLGIPRTMWIDFGSGCSSPAGRSRSGRLIVYQTGTYGLGGSSNKVYFNDFYINGYNYSGQLSISGLGSGGYKLSPNNLRITAPDSSFTYLLSGSLTLAQTSGNATLVANDDLFSITGEWTITGRKGNTGTCTTTAGQFVVMDGSGAEPVSGGITMKATGQSPRVIDFGSGTCDKKFSVTLNTVTSELNIGF